MLNIPLFPVFLAAALLLLLTPGPAVLYIIARSVDQGRVAGLVSVLGIEVGNFVHVIAATVGLSALLMSSALAFEVVKYVGAAYLIYLGVRRMFSRRVGSRPVEVHIEPLRRIFTQGVVVAVLNPKTALFFLAFLPQFVDPTRGSASAQLFVLGCTFVLMAIVTDGIYGLLAGVAGEWIKKSAGFLRAERFVVGGVYIGLGLTTALASVKHK